MSKQEMKNAKHSRISLREDKDTVRAPLLESMPRTNPFTVPDGYFERLPPRIMQRIDSETGEGRTFIRALIAMRWPYKVTLAASVILVAFTVAFLIFKPDYTQELVSEIQQITSSELVEFDGYLVNFDESLVDEWIARKGDGVGSELFDLTSLDDVSDVDIMNYLLTEYDPDEFSNDQ
jgi:hypothetical protein